MIFEIKRNLTDKVFSSTIKFKAFGAPGYDEEAEKFLIDDFGAPTIDVGAIEYKAKFKVEEGKLVIDDLAGEDEIEFVLNSKKVKVDNVFTASYAIDAKREKGMTTVLSTPELVAEAKCILFETKVQAKVAEAIAALRTKGTQFEVDAPIEVTI